MEINGEYQYMRPCPYCGEKYYLSVQIYDEHLFYGRCDNCLSEGPLCGSMKAAVQGWNNRYEEKKTPSVREAVAAGEDTPF